MSGLPSRSANMFGNGRRRWPLERQELEATAGCLSIELGNQWHERVQER